MKTGKRTGILGLAALLSVVLLSRWPALPGNAEAPLPEPAPKPPARLTLSGAASCSGRACHGSAEPGPKRAEYAIWCLQDPHRNAYEVLENPRSVAIAKKLGLKGKASEEERCLACHTTPQAAFADTPFLDERRFGVGCESCHGPASSWIGPHTAPSEWDAIKKRGPDKIQQEYGMNALDQVGQRTRVCAGCHIGAPADPSRGLPLRDMNHDFIAAGHPRLRFEPASYLDNLPPHWPESRQKKMSEAKDWAAGQVVALQCSLDLLADRAEKANRPWPEFSETDCSACHHDLVDPSWRQKRGYAGRKPGATPWNSWYREMPQLLAGREKDPQGEQLVKALQALETQMNSRAPKREKVTIDARDLAGKMLGPLAKKLSHSDWSEEELRSLRKALAEHGREKGLASWDSAWQSGLSLLVVDQKLRDRQKPPVPPTAEQLKRQQELFKQLNPRGFDTNPTFRSREEFDANLRRLFEQLAAD
jgi:Cytochrome c554 and c-prime